MRPKLWNSVIVGVLNSKKPKTILDAPCGQGWLLRAVQHQAEIDGIDLFHIAEKGYRKFLRHDLNDGFPADLPTYDCIVCCEGIALLGNLLLYFKSARDRLNQNGFLILSTPNVWYPLSRVQFLMRGFFPGCPCQMNKNPARENRNFMPWSYPQLYLYLAMSGFRSITLLESPLSRPKYAFEKIIAVPQKLYCRYKLGTTSDEQDAAFWRAAMSPASLYGRHLIITAEK